MDYCTQKPECNVCLLGFETAEEFYASEHWQEVTEKVLERDEHKCELCSGTATVVRTTQWQASLLLGYNCQWFISLCQECDMPRTSTQLRHKVYGKARKGWSKPAIGKKIRDRTKESFELNMYFRNKHSKDIERVYRIVREQKGQNNA